MRPDVNQIKEEIRQYSDLLQQLENEVYKVLIGQKQLYSRILVALLTGGHILLEGLPGLAKTTAIKTLSDCLNTKFQRIQFTPDLLPADLIGTQIYNPKDGNFSVKQGPIFSNIVLADEINRAPAKVQSALLEAMQEHQISIGEETFQLDEPFLVMATQNPIEQEGTYPLPEAQVDRFMLKVQVGYPNREEERKIMDRFTEENSFSLKPVVTKEDLFAMRSTIKKIYIDDKVKDYIVDLVFATREPQKFLQNGLVYPASELKDLDSSAVDIPFSDLIENGASPRATIYLTLAAKAVAFLEGRGYVTPQDVKNIANNILGHRILVTYEAEANEITASDLVNILLREVPVP